MKNGKTDRVTKAISIFRDSGGILRTSQALAKGIHREILYGLRQMGKIVEISRGLYRLKEMPDLGAPDLITVSLRIPNGIICLISSLAFHDITTQIPHHVDIAIRSDSKLPKLDYPPIKTYWYPEKYFGIGVERHELDGQLVPIYCPERTIMDCFKYRNKIGLDVAVEALKLYHERGKMKTELLAEYARMNRVRKIVSPYIEALL